VRETHHFLCHAQMVRFTHPTVFARTKTVAAARALVFLTSRITSSQVSGWSIVAIRLFPKQH